MKPILFILLFTLLISACKKKDEIEITKQSTNIDVSNIKFTGNFAPTAGISANGGAVIYLDNMQLKLTLSNFSVTSGPDLKVYLSKTDTPSDFINLGPLSSNTTLYTIPQQIDIDVYKYVLIHCQQYNHLFATAKLIKK